MKIPEKECIRIMELFQQIRKRQEQDREYTNFKDAPALHEMAALIRPYAARMEEADMDVLEDILAVCRFLGECYREMLRGVYSAEFFTFAFFAAVRMELPVEDAEDLFRSAVKSRNWYVDDPCEDLKTAAVSVMDPSRIAAVFAEASRRTMKRDSVEMTSAYLAVIDEVERKVEGTMAFRGRGSCHERWALTREFLEEYGICWHSPAVLNPGWRFD